MKKLFASFLRLAIARFTSSVPHNYALVHSQSRPVRLRLFCMLLLCATVPLALSPAAAGQAVNATLLGTVTDSSGAVVSGATVTIVESQTGFRRTAKSNESGNYEFANIPQGQYAVTVDHEGFKKVVRSG